MLRVFPLKMFSWKRDRHYVTTQTGASMLTMEKQINKVVAAEDPLVTSDLHQGIGEVNLGRAYFLNRQWLTYRNFGNTLHITLTLLNVSCMTLCGST